MSWLLAAFLVAHGLAHLAVWLAPAPGDTEHAAPFAPDHSAVLAATRVPPTTIHRTAVWLAVAAAVAYVVAGLAVALGSGWTVPLVATAAALLGLALKVLFFHPWLSLGVLFDAAVLVFAVGSWPVALT
jgi:hypothetical protein